MGSSTSSLLTAEITPPLDVLLVDDDSHLLRTLTDILRLRGYAPTTASTGEEGLALLSGPRPLPAIALVDLALPDMPGLSLVHELRRLSNLTEVVILTGNASLESAVGAIREQSYDYLIKPVPPDRLVMTLDRAGERWRRRRAEDALVRSEERLRLLVENISDVVLVLDQRGCVTYASPSLETTLGYAPVDLLGRAIAPLVHEEEGALFGGLLQSPPQEAVDLRFRRKDGSWGLFSCRTKDLLGEPAISGLIFIAQDITERRRLEVQAQQAQRLDSIGRLAGGVAHDFNNLLSIVLGYSDLALQDDGAQGELRRLLEGIHQAGKRGAALTRQLLAFARRQPTAPRVIDVNQLVLGLDGLLRRTLGEDVVLHYDLHPDPGRVRADPSQLEQILMNLAVNAREAMPGGGTLLISTRPVAGLESPGSTAGSESGAYLWLRVRDDGVGMTPEVQQRLFEPFFTTKETGTGLGLSTAYGIIHQAGGSVAVESAVGEGSTIDILLPVSSEPADHAQEPVPSLERPRGTETVLVVEDQPAVRHLVRDVLESQGYRVLQAGSGEEALDLVLAAEIEPQMVISDLVMPGFDGYELARRLQEKLPDLRILLMSGYSHARVGAAPEEWPLLQKPFSPGALVRAVREGLDAQPRTIRGRGNDSGD